jgi:hypothetical protein
MESQLDDSIKTKKLGYKNSYDKSDFADKVIVASHVRYGVDVIYDYQCKHCDRTF